jgi:uncharacterized membrane protein YqjE
MATERPIERQTIVPNRVEGAAGAPPAAPPPPPATDASLGDLVRELAQDSATLIRQEMELAKIEMRENFRSFARSAMMLAVGGGVLLVGLLVLTAFLVVLLGDLLDNYWLGALIVGALYALVGGILLMRGKSNLEEENLRPDHTIASLQEDKRWAQAEVQQVKQDLTS